MTIFRRYLIQVDDRFVVLKLGRWKYEVVESALVRRRVPRWGALSVF